MGRDHLVKYLTIFLVRIVHAMSGKEFIEYDNPVRRRDDRPPWVRVRVLGHEGV
jgi:hypothetical protein